MVVMWEISCVAEIRVRAIYCTYVEFKYATQYSVFGAQYLASMGLRYKTGC